MGEAKAGGLVREGIDKTMMQEGADGMHKLSDSRLKGDAR